MRTRKNSDQVHEELRAENLQPEALQRVADLMSIGALLECLAPDPSNKFEGFGELISLTDYGKAAISSAFGSNYDEDISKLSCLCVFYHHEVLIDSSLSNIEKLLTHLDFQVSKSKLRMPDSFGRALYDRFNRMPWADRLDQLSASQLEDLLEGTEQGVCQAGRLSVGPLGVRISQCRRLILPPNELPLWHCSDPGCNALHGVQLLRYSTILGRAIRRLRKALTDSQGEESHWRVTYRSLMEEPREIRRKPYSDLVPALASTLPVDEREKIVELALAGEAGDFLRSALVGAKGKDFIRKSHKVVASRLTGSEQVHLLSLLPDRSLVHLIDEAIKSGDVSVPPTETRSARFAHVSRYDERAEISSLGIRSAVEDPAIVLSSMIYKAYEQTSKISDLAWRINRHEATPESALEYMRERGLPEAVRNLILSSRSIAENVANYLFINIYDIDSNVGNVTDKILWKAGFDVPRYDEKYSRFRSSVASFSEILYSFGAKLDAADREKIRSNGVNVFVYLEDFIEELITYNIWILSSDHFTETKYKYERSVALGCISRVLGEKLLLGGQIFSWNSQGGNSLGVLLVYARAAAAWIEGLTTAERGPFQREAADLPHFAHWPDRYFPFRSVCFWADTDKDGLRDFASRFEKIVSALEKSDAARIRNSLDHYRQNKDFPNVDSIVSCISELRSALDMADAQRFIPKVWWATERVENNFGISSVKLRDYTGREVPIGLPRVTIGVRQPDFNRPLLYAPGNLMGNGGSEICFELIEDSAYSKYWSQYPLRISVEPNVLSPEDSLAETS